MRKFNFTPEQLNNEFSLTLAITRLSFVTMHEPELRKALREVGWGLDDIARILRRAEELRMFVISMLTEFNLIGKAEK